MAAEGAPEASHAPAKEAEAIAKEEEEEEQVAMTDEACAEKYAKAVAIINGDQSDGDGYDAAIDLLTDVLEFKCEKHGELAIECAPAFYNYGLALFGKARLENDVFGEPVQKAMVEKAIHQLKQEAEKEQGESVEEEDAGAGGSGAAAAEEDEEDLEAEENDMELAWRNLETARLIYSKQGKHEKEIADVYAALAELSMEREDFETSICDFKEAIAILAASKLPGCERILAEYHYKLSLALQLQSKSANANQAQLLQESQEQVRCAVKLLSSLEKEDPSVKEVKEELQELIEELEENSKQLMQQQSGAMASGPRSQLGFDKSSMGGNKENLGTVGRGVNRVSLQPIKKQKTDK